MTTVVFLFLCYDDILNAKAWARFFQDDAKAQTIAHFKTKEAAEKATKKFPWLSHSFSEVETKYGYPSLLEAEVFLYAKAKELFPAAGGYLYTSGCSAPILSLKYMEVNLLEKSWSNGRFQKTAIQKLPDFDYKPVFGMNLQRFNQFKFLPAAMAADYCAAVKTDPDLCEISAKLETYFVENRIERTENPKRGQERPECYLEEILFGHWLKIAYMRKKGIPMSAYDDIPLEIWQRGQLVNTPVVYLDPRTSCNTPIDQRNCWVKHETVSLCSKIMTTEQALECIVDQGAIFLRHVENESLSENFPFRNVLDLKNTLQN